MKTQKITFGFLLLMTIGILTSCTKFDRPAELSIDTQVLEFNKDVLVKKFSIVNAGDAPLTVMASSNKPWVNILNADVTLSYAQTSTATVTINPAYFQEYGVYYAYLYLKSNGGNFTIPIEVYYLQDAAPQLAIDLDYLKFSTNATKDYITIYNDGAQMLNFTLKSEASWLLLSQKSGSVIPNGEKRINIEVNRLGLTSGFYSTKINITSNGGSAQVDIDMDVLIYSITFFNPVYTPILIKTPGFDNKVIDIGGRHTYIFPKNPTTFAYTASTKGQTGDGKQLGVEIKWAESINVSSFQSPIFNLNVNADYFFMAVKNTGNRYLELWSVNYGNSFQIDDDFFIPNDGVEYGVAYYDAFDDTDIYARLRGTTYDVKWSNGIEFIFPWKDNQYILLENNFKKIDAVRANLKSSSESKSKVQPFVKPIQKDKGSIDLYNK